MKHNSTGGVSASDNQSAAPAQPVGPSELTDERIDAIRRECPPSAGIDFDQRCRDFARAIEREVRALLQSPKEQQQ